MDYIPRHLEDRFVRLSEHFPAVVVTGARQTGKTTMIKKCVGSGTKTITFDPVMDIGNARADPDYFLQNNPLPVFLDEIQYAPELLGAIKRRVDENRVNGQYFLSGSQNLSVLKNISESLAGRAAVLNLMGMSFRELTRQLKSPSYLALYLETHSSSADVCSTSLSRRPGVFVERAFRGGYPGTLTLPEDLLTDYWSSYMQTYIERDVRKVADIRQQQTFGRFIRLLAALSSCEINFNELGRELGVDRNTAVLWTDIARATYQWYTLPAFTRNAVKRIAGKEKGYFADTGFLCYLLAISSPNDILSHPAHGSIFETFVMLEILKIVQELGIREHVYHYRTYSGAEVDCIIEHDGRLVLIEIRATSMPRKKHTSGFASFRKCFPHEKISQELIICAVAEPLRISDTCMAIPWWML